jgi:hypothetical protein
VLAAATGAILTYGWISITRMIAGTTALGVPTTTVDVVGQIFLLLGTLALIGMAGHRLARIKEPGHPTAGTAPTEGP